MKWLPAFALMLMLAVLYGATFSRTLYREAPLNTQQEYELPASCPLSADANTRANTASGILTIFSAIFLYYMLILLFKSKLIAFSLALFFATSPHVWKYATYAHPHTLPDMYILITLIIIFPAGFLLAKMSRSRYKLIIFYTSLLVILIWPAANLGNQFIRNNRSDYVFMERYLQYECADRATPYAADNLFLPSAEDNSYHQSLIARYYYDLAAESYKKGNFQSGQRFLVWAISHDPKALSEYYGQTITIRNRYFSN